VQQCPTAPAFYALEYWHLFSEGLCKGYSTNGGGKDTQRDGYKAGMFALYQNVSTTVHKLHSKHVHIQVPHLSHHKRTINEHITLHYSEMCSLIVLL